MEDKFEDMNLEQTRAEANKYYRKYKKLSLKNKLYEKIISTLTEQSISDFITEDESKRLIINDEAIAVFKRGGEAGDKIRKANALVTDSQSKIEELNNTVRYLDLELDKVTSKLTTEVKTLKDELEHIKRDDSIERLRNLISSLSKQRKVLPLKDLQLTVDSQSHLMSQLFGTEYTSKENWEDFCQGQKEIELSIIEACSELLRNVFDELPHGINKLSKETIEVDVTPVLQMMSDSRNRLSYVMAEQSFISFLQEHVGEIQGTLDLLNSRARQSSGYNKTFDLNLSPYEKGLIYFKDGPILDSYLTSYTRPIETQRRLLLHGRNSGQLHVFNGFDEFPSFLLFCQPEDTVKILLTKCKLINNACFIPLKGFNGPDPFSFYILESIKDEKRTWKLDPHALFVIRSFKHQYLNLGEKIFKQFYKDVFNHNEFKAKFEEQMKSRGIERWKQMSILYENMQIVGDEYLIGEIIRKILRTFVIYHPKEETDIIKGEKDLPDAHADFKRVRDRWRRGLPPSDEEPEEYLNHCFDKYKDWRIEMSLNKYKQRWTVFLQQNKMIEDGKR